ncbi:hypothetical protein ACHWQZ_G001199 [Mnemiopsis leidyi]
MIRTTQLAQHLRQNFRNSPLLCTRHASTNIKISDVVRRLNKYNPLSWLYRFFTPNQLKNVKLSDKEKKQLSSRIKAQFFIFPGFITLMGLVFYNEWTERIELLEDKETFYDRRLELSVDRFKAGRGVAKWDKTKYAQWVEDDQTTTSQTDTSPAVSILGGIDSLYSISSSSDPPSPAVVRERKRSVTRELCEIGDRDSTPTLLGQLKGK